MEKRVEVQAMPDLNDMSRVSGVRLTMPGQRELDLNVEEAKQLINDIATELARVRVVLV